VEAKRIKPNKQGHESKRETSREVEGEGKWGIGLRKNGGMMNMSKLYYMHVWKCHNETNYLYYLYMLIKINLATLINLDNW
jgi:hypothetical protein